MEGIKWVKIATDIFDNRKIRQIETLPEADSILIIWLKILCLAGDINENGLIVITKDIPYTDEMLANEFNRPLNVVRLALEVFNKFGMIEIINDVYCVSNWERYQNIDRLEKIREQTKKRVSKFREKQKQLALNESNVTSNVTVTPSNATEEEKEKEEEIYKYIVEIINYLNKVNRSSYRASTKSTQKHIRARLTEGYNVEDFKQVIDLKVKEWKKDKKMKQYLRPETLFGTKFESYLQNCETESAKGTEHDVKEYQEIDIQEISDEQYQKMVRGECDV